jgi:hypothetical protein
MRRTKPGHARIRVGKDAAAAAIGPGTSDQAGRPGGASAEFRVRPPAGAPCP